MVVKKAPPRRKHALDLLEELRGLREREDWTQEELAQKMKMPFITINRWHRGISTPRSQTTLDAIEKFLARHRKARE